MNIDVFPDGRLIGGGRTYRCALGRSGVSSAKREGDGTTPAGTWPLKRVFWRADRLEKPETKLPLVEITEQDAWCDDADDSMFYNTFVKLPHKGSYEELWREDHIYDLIVEIGYNDPPEPGKGSAIFLHVARAGYTATAGCVAVSLPDLLAIVERLASTSKLTVHSN